MTTDELIQSYQSDVLAMLQRTGRMSALTGTGWLPEALAADAIGVSIDGMRRLRERAVKPLRFRAVGGSKRHRWLVELGSIAAYMAENEQRE